MEEFLVNGGEGVRIGVWGIEVDLDRRGKGIIG